MRASAMTADGFLDHPAAHAVGFRFGLGAQVQSQGPKPREHLLPARLPWIEQDQDVGCGLVRLGPYHSR